MTSGLPRLSECRDCHDPIRFVRMTATGKSLPVNPSPNPDGNVAARLLAGQLVGFVISQDNRPGPLDRHRFIAHHATCEAIKRKPKSTQPAAADAPLF